MNASVFLAAVEAAEGEVAAAADDPPVAASYSFLQAVEAVEEAELGDVGRRRLGRGPGPATPAFVASQGVRAGERGFVGRPAVLQFVMARTAPRSAKSP
eukprot:15470546-Alexandrium_andersonii.AAC.1